MQGDNMRASGHQLQLNLCGHFKTLNKRQTAPLKKKVSDHCTGYLLEMAWARPKMQPGSRAVASTSQFSDSFPLKTFGSIQKPM